jgi:lipoate-protein ligase A
MTGIESPWRLVCSPPLTGPENMSIDDAILQAVASEDSPPTLRLYRWSPACLSLGYGQRFRDVDEAGLKMHGWDVVRRPTGGKAILHTDELTYSISARADHPLMEGGILPSYRRIAAALMAGLDRLAVGAVTREKYQRSASDPGPVCFEVPSDWEITWQDKKLIGSAQVRRRDRDRQRGAVLQHGTLPLVGNLGRITLALAFENEADRSEAAARIPERAATLERALGRAVEWQEAADAIAAGFTAALGYRLEEGKLTPGEIELARAVCVEKYGNPDWVRRR